MTQVPLHPQLRLRPVRNPHLRRPSREHPVFGKLEYVNTDGGWWKGTTTIDGTAVRVDVQEMTNIAIEALDRAGSFVTWIQSNGSVLRRHIGSELLAGNVFELQQSGHGALSVSQLPDTNLLHPFMLVIWTSQRSQRMLGSPYRQ